MLNIDITNIQHELIDNEFNQLKVTYRVLKDGEFIKRVKRYVQEDFNYEELENMIYDIEKDKPIKTYEKALINESEIEEVEEIQNEEEVF